MSEKGRFFHVTDKEKQLYFFKLLSNLTLNLMIDKGKKRYYN